MSNIRDVISGKHDYVWLKINFCLPEFLREKQLGLFISYLHFADKVWANGIYVGGYGNFPPNERSPLWEPHLYAISKEALNATEQNTILIKVYCKGRAGISDKVILGAYDKIREIHRFRIFLQSSIYIFAEGAMFFAAVSFFLIYIWRKKEKEYITFSCISLSSMMLTTPFIAPDIPLIYPNPVPYLFFLKVTFGEGLYLIVYFLSILNFEFLKKKTPEPIRITRIVILILSTLPTVLAPNLDALTKICPFTLALSIIQLVLPFVYFVFTKDIIGTNNKIRLRVSKDFRVLSSAFIPLVLAIPLDIIIKLVLKKVDHPYLSLIGWMLTILNFILIISNRYNRAVVQNEYLNVQLRNEVEKQTLELSQKNTKLEEEIRRAETDLEMASVVQKKFFPYPPKSLRGWDIAVSYSPLDKVSGDMYDFYTKYENLNGFSLFDVSGHGVAASLITMLAKNIVYQSFLRNRKKNETVSRTLYEINKEIIETKGEIENYLTGLMFRFGDFDEKDECIVEMANAGHPNPILYSAKSTTCGEIESGSAEEHHGAIGLDFITVSFPQRTFTMAQSDILLFYTDGLTEGRNSQNEMFGKERVQQILKAEHEHDAQTIMNAIIEEYQEFTQGVKRDDDITIVIMKRENSADYIEELMEI